MGLRETLLAKQDRPLRGPVRVPVWDEEIWIRTISAGERFWLHGRIHNGVIPYADLAAIGAGNADGTRIFSDDDVDRLNEHNPAPIEAIGRLVLEHNRMRPEDTDAAEKKSEASPS